MPIIQLDPEHNTNFRHAVQIDLQATPPEVWGKGKMKYVLPDSLTEWLNTNCAEYWTFALLDKNGMFFHGGDTRDNLTNFRAATPVIAFYDAKDATLFLMFADMLLSEDS
jgi:hypothetical protein